MLTAENILSHNLRTHQETIAQLEPLLPEVGRLAEKLWSCLANGGKILWMGNGGSAADSQHLAAELVGRFQTERRGLASIALTTDTSILTSVSNDYSYEQVFARQVEALCRPEDVLIGISTSGNSANIVSAIQRGKEIGATTIGLTGEGGGQLKTLCDLTLAIPSKTTARVQEAHILIGHMLCELIDHYAGHTD